MVDPEKLEKRRKYGREHQKEYYIKNKPREQIRKKLWQKRIREEAIKHLGDKCASCGEPYNPHARPSNLQFDHKFYIQSKFITKNIASQILNQVSQGIDPNKQFMLLCHTCHMIITHVRKDQRKAKSTLDLITKLGILK